MHSSKLGHHIITVLKPVLPLLVNQLTNLDAFSDDVKYHADIREAATCQDSKIQVRVASIPFDAEANNSLTGYFESAVVIPRGVNTI